jgi:hypothetical protein
MATLADAPADFSPTVTPGQVRCIRSACMIALEAFEISSCNWGV